MTKSKMLENLRKMAGLLEPIVEGDSDASQIMEDLDSDAEDFLEAVQTAIALIEPDDEDDDEFDEDEDEFDEDNEPDEGD